MSKLILAARRALSRRDFIRYTFGSAAAAGAAALLPACAGSGSGGSGGSAVRSRFADIGALTDADANGLRLPAGFRSRVVAVSGVPPLPGSTYLWHTFPDAGATYATPDGGWIYVSNSEVPASGLVSGGVGALKFAADGTLQSAYPILTGSSSNCGGGATPWRTWLSGEERDGGLVWECNPFEKSEGTSKPALGRFAHEALAVDPADRTLYLTEDAGDGRFYRFVPSAADWPAGAERPALQEGRLQVLRFAEGARGATLDDAGLNVNGMHAVIWEDVVQPDQAQAGVRSALGAEAPGSRFRGGEGIWHHEGLIYFSTKGDNRIWCHDIGRETIEVIYDFATAENPVLSGVDNLTVSEFGDVLVAEDGGDMQICVILPDRRVLPLLQLVDHSQQSEITGPAFSPDGSRLYFSSQRNGRNGLPGLGITFEVTLPFSACPNACP
ncbi:alkaline phosphatase PhoX [Fontimonas sp. SYSU GA230001]|uniref:alkaline phosphatase PhoX n=1 Tax=Fontimonas sp. SYSU GA230001 TaxID=3142450 RepID=UPI0032B3E070